MFYLINLNMKKITILLSALFAGALFTHAQDNGRVQAASGRIIGMTSGGGSKGHGVVYGYNTVTHKDTVRINLGSGGNDGVYPFGSLVQASNGLMYGTTFEGGTYNDGVLFCFNPVTRQDTVLLNFNGTNGNGPQCTLIQASDGLLYGTTQQGGSAGNGVFFSFNPVTYKDSVIFSFTGPNGAGPATSVVQATNGLLYGLTPAGGTNGDGVLYSFNIITRKDSVMLNLLNATTGSLPFGNLIQASDGFLYGMTTYGGTNNQGTLFQFDPVTSHDSIMLSFNGTNGALPNGGLIEASNHWLYGMTNFGGGGNNGVVFGFNPVTSDDTVVLTFNGGSNGWGAEGNVMQASNGLLYGMTYFGGTYNLGVMFSYNIITGQDSVIVNFNGLGNWPNAGSLPYGNLIQATNGGLYGLVYQGGATNHGVIFDYRVGEATDSTLHSFGGGGNTGNFIFHAGHLFGLTQYGGPDDVGTMFRYNPKTGQDTLLLNFNDTNGALPQINNNVLLATDGNLYGSTVEGGTNNQGVLFRYNPVTGKDTVLINFNNPVSGANPYGNVMQASNGMLYGTAVGGGTKDSGVIYRYNPITLKDTVIYNGTQNNGGWIYGDLVQAPNGKLYGMTTEGGAFGYGVIYDIDPVTNAYTKKIDLDGTTLGGYPYGGMILAQDGMLYGMTYWGGTSNNGVLFQYNPTTNKDSILVNFNYNNGQGPMGQLVQDTISGLLFGTTPEGGNFNYGVLFYYDLVAHKDSVLMNFADTNGSSPTSIVFLTSSQLGVNEVTPATKDVVMVYPNPFRYVANIVFTQPGIHYVEVYDINGKLLRSITANGRQYQLERDGMAVGMYTLKVYDSDKHFTSSGKIMVQ